MNARTYRLYCLSHVLSPLTHMKGVSGDESLVAREPIATSRGIQHVPCLSGNQIRHRLVREPGWRWLIDRWGLRGQLTLPMLNYAFHGGNLTEGGGREDTRRIVDLQRIFPLSRLVGGTLPDQIIPGALDVWRGRLVCEENRAGLQADLPKDWRLPEQSLRPAEAFVSGYQYTRGDCARTTTDLLPEPDANGRQRGENVDGKSNLMLFSGQAVTVGACFLHGFVLKHVSELELGALLLSLRLWQQAGGTVGGQAARGHGRLETRLHLSEGQEDTAVQAYVTHCETVKDEARAWLEAAFAPRNKKAKEVAS